MEPDPNRLFEAITNPAYTPPLPSPTPGGDPVPGGWSLDWGPANGEDGNGDNSNLIYIASHRAPDGKPNFFVVGIRGTDTSIKGKPLYQQLFQDIRDFELWSWPQLLTGKIDTLLHGRLTLPTPNTSDAGTLTGRIAHGSALGFVKLANSTAALNNGKTPVNGKPALTVLAALNSLTAPYPGTPIVVTGHSLGACQTQLMASYLAWQMPAFNVIPFGYAPPTAGDAEFIATYSSQCPWGQFWYNDHDVVPYAFVTLTHDYQQQSGLSWAAKNLWSAYRWPAGDFAGPPLPIEMVALIDTVGKLIPPDYRRPANGVLPLAGNIPDPKEIEALLKSMGMMGLPATSGLAQLIWQHFPPCYAGLMTAQYGAHLAPFAFKAFVPGVLNGG